MSVKVLIVCDRCERTADFCAMTVMTTENRAKNNGWKIKTGTGSEPLDLCPDCARKMEAA